MQPLDRDLRKKLETTVKEARTLAEQGAAAALARLGVSAPRPPTYLTDTERELRRRLRAHARQVRDADDALDDAGITALVEEVAYQHWHRMLFARWLAELDLLMAPDPVAPVPVTLADCVELAAELGAEADGAAVDAWELAARFAAVMLPQIFRPDSPIFQLRLPPETQHALEALVVGLEPALFHATDALGWVYQFWQSKRKDEVNAAEVKIGARELPAVTQLFTEPYMVSFLLDNTLGAWWVGKRCGMGRMGDWEIERLESGDWGGGGEVGVAAGGLTEEERAARERLRTAASEQELRDYFSLPGVPLTYLRFVREEIGEIERLGEGEIENAPPTQSPNPAIPESRNPAIPFWRPAAGWFTRWPATLDAFKVLDPCCGSGHFLVAVFLMLVAMRQAQEGLDAAAACDAVLAENLHGLELDARCVEIAAFALALAAWRYPGAGGYRPLPRLKLACSGLAIRAPKTAWLALAQQAADAPLADGAGEAASNLAFWKDQVAESLWHTQLAEGMAALYDLFQEAPLLGSLIDPNRITGDFFRADYAALAELVAAALAAEESRRPPHARERGPYEMGVVAQGLAEAATLLAGRYDWVVTNVPYLARGKQGDALRRRAEQEYADAKQDLATLFLDRALAFCRAGGVTSSVLPQNWLFLGSYAALRRRLLTTTTWRLLARLGPGAFDTISGEVVKAILLVLEQGRAPAGQVLCGLDVAAARTVEAKAAALIENEIAQVEQAVQLGNPDASITLDDISQSIPRLGRFAEVLQGVGTTDTPRFVVRFWEAAERGGIWEFYQVAPTGAEVSGMTSLLKWENGQGDLAQIGTAHKGRKAIGKTGLSIAVTRTPYVSMFTGTRFDCTNAVIIPNTESHLTPITAYLTSSEFERDVRKVDQALSITESSFTKVPFDLDHWTRVAAERYPDGLPKPYSPDPTQWLFHGHPADSTAPLQVAVARLLGYRWPAESDPTLELANDARAWVARSAALLPLADKDGIVCLPPVRGELAATDRLLALLAAAYGDAWHAGKLDTLLAAAGWAGKSLDAWLRDQFFADHCRLFQQRPFLWHVWDGQRDGFAAIVNYHRLDHKLLEALIYTYLGDWIIRQRADQAAGVEGAASRLAAAAELKQRLELILHGEAPYDIFVRWKAAAAQPIGWTPDLHDGVRLNIRPWLSVPDIGKKGAGVLRERPNIKWEKDRGKDTASAPWYARFGGARINDHHLTRAEKLAAREAFRNSVS